MMNQGGAGPQLAFLQESHHPGRVFPGLGLVLEAEGLRYFFAELPSVLCNSIMGTSTSLNR